MLAGRKKEKEQTTHHDIPKLLSPIASDAHVHHFRQRSGKVPEPVTHPLIRRTGDGEAERRLRGRELRHGSRGERGRKADKARRDNSNTPPSSALSRSPPHVRRAIHVTTPRGNRLAPRHPHYLIESAASHQVIQVTGTVRISVGRRMIRCSTGCTRIPTGAENRRNGEPEQRRQSGADANDRESWRNSTPKPDPSRNTRNAPNEAPP